MIYLIGLTFLSLLLWWTSPIKLAYTFDKSISYKWWIEVKGFKTIQKGDYVSFKPPVENEYTKGKVLVKKVACNEGEYLYVKGLDYYCNGVYLGRARTTDSKGRPVSPFVFNGEIPKGYLFVMGENERSYDSRYMGLIPKSNIQAKLIPIAKSPSLDWVFLR